MRPRTRLSSVTPPDATPHLEIFPRAVTASAGVEEAESAFNELVEGIAISPQQRADEIKAVLAYVERVHGGVWPGSRLEQS
jgi:hypothetical protein